MTVTAAASRSRSGRSRSTAASSASTAAVSNASWTQAWMISSLLSKTRKMVPSAMPAALAISRVLMPRPLSRSSGIVAAMIEARRSSGAIAGARGDMITSMSE